MEFSVYILLPSVLELRLPRAPSIHVPLLKMTLVSIRTPLVTPWPREVTWAGRASVGFWVTRTPVKMRVAGAIVILSTLRIIIVLRTLRIIIILRALVPPLTLMQTVPIVLLVWLWRSLLLGEPALIKISCVCILWTWVGLKSVFLIMWSNIRSSWIVAFVINGRHCQLALP